MAYKISDMCIECGTCAENCPVNAIEPGDGKYVINLTVPEGMKAVLYVPDNAVVKINSVAYYQNGKYTSGKVGNVEIVEK